MTLHYERNPEDPRVLHELALVVDEYGNTLRGASIAYPRRPAGPGRPGPEIDGQARPLVTITERSFIHCPAEPEGWYRINVPREESTWDLTGVPIVAGQLLRASPLDTFFSTVDEAGFEEEVGFDVAMKRLVARTRNRYLSDDLSGPLPFGTAHSRALPYESYKLAFTQGLLAEVFGDQVDPGFLASEGRYIPMDGAWWAPSGRVIPSSARFYQPVAAVDPFGNGLLVSWDAHSLLVGTATDQIGNIVTAENCYRVLAPRQVTDPNGNRTAVEFDALGLVVKTALMGKVGAGEGDTLADPTTSLAYDLHAWEERGLPVFVQTEAREQHGSANPRWQRSISYSDGHGQEVMKKVQAEPGLAPKRDAGGLVLVDGAPVLEHTNDRWVGTGRTVFNNKGKPVKQYEPFFSSTSAYEDEQDVVESGVTPVLHYDPVGRLVRTEQPDGTEVRVVFDAWTQLNWDENDSLVRPEDLSYLQWDDRLADPPPEGLEYLRWAKLRIEPEYDGTPERRALELSLPHVWTPGYSRLDVLGRPVVSVENNGDAGQYETRITLDIVGNQRVVQDARGNLPAVQVFDLLKRPLRVVSCDAGCWFSRSSTGRSSGWFPGMTQRALTLPRPVDSLVKVEQSRNSKGPRARWVRTARPRAVVDRITAA